MEAIKIIESALEFGRTEQRSEWEKRDWVQEVVKLLDMAIIMAGAPER